ncbi:DEAD/DEAH box helicase [Rhodoferax antarcticus]|uniref:DEAD/DEAH box helicase n=1 Tax=Rhodoferax antarcticus TaxID=81479 RepID=UPI002225947A|nr:ATP-binding domain-containing protein [Rhodoferax antarcticus]MCW2312214.1 superfamily I DNA and RNA helicase [Rhodoferax antarcticus]
MVDIVWGSAKDKPESSKLLATALAAIEGPTGYLYIGYPVMGSPTGPVKFDALLLSPTAGLIAFDLVEALDIGGYEAKQDEIASMLEVKLKPYADLKNGRNLRFDINVVTFAPSKTVLPASHGQYFIANSESLEQAIKNFKWNESSAVYSKLVAAIQVVTSIRGGRQKREPKRDDSRGARLKRVEDSIANLDQHQSQAVIETVEGVQRIRGLAGSGKTIVLALKVAYLHAQNEDWQIGVTFNTRSLKEQFKRLINNFTIEQTGSEPDWEKIDILNAWGGPGDKEQDGLYHKFCRQHGLEFIDFGRARARFGNGKEFEGVCGDALLHVMQKEEKPLYDLMLVDEAQDFPPEFLRLCFQFLKPPKRLVYAYDELQSLTGNAVLPPEELFGKDEHGKPIVLFTAQENSTARQDIILEKCYRNSRPLLATAHALGFGVYRKGGLVQFFDQDSLWTDVGYVVSAGELTCGHEVTLTRTEDSSPRFLEDHSPPEDLIQFRRFDSAKQQAEWLATAIKDDIENEELRPEDIVVINPNPLTTEKEVSPIRGLLFGMEINSEIAGVSTSRDVFSKIGAVTFTGIFRAKGNEAGMVYIINAHDCFSSFNDAQLALVRNRIFTAITRSKAWVRVLGIGPKMDGLIEEWSALKQNDYQLKFVYPTIPEKLRLRITNKAGNPQKRTRLRKLEAQTDDLLSAIASGDVDADQLIRKINESKALSRKK